MKKDDSGRCSQRHSQQVQLSQEYESHVSHGDNHASMHSGEIPRIVAALKGFQSYVSLTLPKRQCDGCDGLLSKRPHRYVPLTACLWSAFSLLIDIISLARFVHLPHFKALHLTGIAAPVAIFTWGEAIARVRALARLREWQKT